ncbi:hypothetical protein [Desulfonatronum thioautotrophicum]|uniref:hypothetical protein n=1 Tax=Desulfonatronum thioautotrophicum TaxID=617001 RepID=UPI0005EB79E8|nr:hypothetical protein [Desulfonatronum thioautotrophicum]
MSHIENMANELATEVISEAAETFFGQRKTLEEEMERFTIRARQVVELGEQVARIQNVLHAVLLDTPTIQEFYGLLNIPCPDKPEAAPARDIFQLLGKPSAWSLRGRYSKLLVSAYTRTHAEVDAYLHGGYRDDPAHPKRKIAYGGYLKIQDWAEKLNKTIAKLNTEQSPGEVLQFVKGLDATTCAMEKAAGASCDTGRDRGMLYTCVDFSALDLPAFPEYPPPARVQKDLQQFAKQVCSRRESTVRELLQELEQGGQ